MKRLNEDIKRITKLMGVEKNLISEQGVYRLFGLGDEVAEILNRAFERHVDDLAETGKLTRDEVTNLRNIINNGGMRTEMATSSSLSDLAQRWISRSGQNLGREAEKLEITKIRGLLEKFQENSEALTKNVVDEILETPNLGNYGGNRFIDLYNHSRTALENYINNARNLTDLQDVKIRFRRILEDTNLLDNFPELLNALVSRIESDARFRDVVRQNADKFERRPDFIETPKIGQNIDDATGRIPTLMNVPELARIVQAFKRLYVGYIKRVTSIVEIAVRPNAERSVQNFDRLLKAAFDETLKRGSASADLLNIYKLKLSQSFFELGKILQEGVNYKALWDELRSNVNESYSGKDLEIVNKFLDDLLEHNGNKDFYVSIKQAIDELSGGKSGDASEEFMEKIQDAAGSVVRKNMDETTKKAVPTMWKRLLYLYGTGSYGSPKMMMQSFIKKGYRRGPMLYGVIKRFFYLNICLPILGMGVEASWDSLCKYMAENTEDPNWKKRWVSWAGEEASGETNYWKEWVINGVTSELSNDSFWGKVSRFVPGFIDDTVVVVTSFVAENVGKNVTDEDDVIADAGEEAKDTNYLQKITDISEPISLKIPFGESDTAYEDLDVKIQKLNNGESLDGYDTLSKYFRFKSLEESDSYYFFFKNDPNKKLKLVRHTDYSEDGEHATGTHFTAKDETGKEYKNNEMVTFTKHLLDLINNDNILSIEEYDKMILESPKEVKGLIKKKLSGLKGESLNKTTDNILKEMNEGKKFGEDNFKHWKDTFKFKKYDEKTNQLKDVKITAKMDEIMDRINHFRKKYDEDDSFVRAVIDVYGTGIDIIQYTKGLAHLTEGVIVGGLLGVLSTIRESKELVTWTVKHYKDGNWELVKGNFNKKELLNVGKTKRERDERQKESDNPAEGLKKKEQESIMILSRDEKEGLNGLPTKVKQKVKEKLRQGWTTEKPFDFLNTYYSESEINSVFNDKIKIYKLKPSAEFFRTLAKNSSKVTVKKGFCKSVKNAKGEYDLSEREKNTLNHFISKCESKFGV